MFLCFTVVDFNKNISHMTSICISITFISHSFFMKIRQLRQSNDILFQVCFYYFEEGIYIQSIIFSYFNTRVSKLNYQPFLPFSMLPPYFYSDLSLHKFSYILLYCYYLDVAILHDAMRFEFNLFL